MPKKLALGKGIASLIKESSHFNSSQDLTEKSKNFSNTARSKSSRQSSDEQEVIQRDDRLKTMPSLVSISQIVPNPNQPRKIFKEKELQELANSISENGLIQPIVVSENEGSFEIIAGERRFLASKLAGLDRVPVIIKRGTDKDKMIMSIIENVQRSDLNCVEEALAYYHLIDEYKLTQEEVAKKLGKERSSVANFLRILKLPRNVIDLLQKEKISFGHGKVLASYSSDRELVVEFSNQCAQESWSVRQLEDFLKVASRKKKGGDSSLSGNKLDSSYTKFLKELDHMRVELEESTGFHYNIKTNKKGAGQIALKFNNKEELDQIFQFLKRS